MKNALTSLPCVDSSSVNVNITTKEARFKPKEGKTVDIEEVKNAVAEAGNYKVTAVRPPEKSTAKAPEKK